jgi:Fe2+ transport system protein FeoA
MLMVLSDLNPGDTFRIRNVTAGGEIGKRLADMGLTRGAEGLLVRCALLGDPILIRIRDYNLSLRRAEAAGVTLDLVKRAPGNGRRKGA